MKIEFVPLLQLQRDLYNIPRGQERFRVYLETMLDADASAIKLPPLAVMNPMGKEHIPAMLDTLLAMNSDTIADRAIAHRAAAKPIAEALDGFEEDSGTLKLGLVVADDLMGEWTNRYTSEFSDRFETKHSLKRGWLSGTLWTSEVPSIPKVREVTLTTVYRAAYIRRYGFARTLQEMLNQEGYAMAMAGCRQPNLDADDLVYTREIVAPHLSTQDYPTIVACLFGDRAARSLGYTPQGLSEYAGLALALYQAQNNKSA
ncbi:hypothetical protein HC931_11465 [Candidatus Gracilibacteria bacterium]|nr:hypothetical protein [Candidatus Gracilibacteria bacterium]NJM87721.1 hypothetical protein [Hydrococcus sp. RU_2_2]